MNMKLKRTIGQFFLGLFGIATMVSCSEDFPSNIESDQFTDLKAIKIVNAGASGNEVLDGTIDENTKTITFPRLDTLSDFSNIKFEAVTSEGAQLEKDVVAIPYQSGRTQTEIYLKVTNLPRFKEYKAVIRFKVPIYGANFDAPAVYDFSKNDLGNDIYPSFVTANTRGSGFDGKHVLVIERGGLGPHLLEVAKLKNNVTTPISLNMDGVEGGTFPINMGAQVHGHTYIASLSGGTASPLKIYHWATPSQKPDVVINVNVAELSGAGARHGDTFSINVDQSGNGYAFFMAAEGKIIRIKIENFKTGSEPTVLAPRINYEQWGHFSQIGSTESYILSGHAQPLSLVNNAGSISYTVKAASLPRSLSDVKIFTFNGHRYMLGITVPRNSPTEGASLYLYNITTGSNIVDAFTALEQTAIEGKLAPEVFKYNIVTATNPAPGSQAGYYIEKDATGKDEKLLIYGASTQGGFAIIEFGRGVAED